MKAPLEVGQTVSINEKGSERQEVPVGLRGKIRRVEPWSDHYEYVVDFTGVLWDWDYFNDDEVELVVDEAQS